MNRPTFPASALLWPNSVELGGTPGRPRPLRQLLVRSLQLVLESFILGPLGSHLPSADGCDDEEAACLARVDIPNEQTRAKEILNGMTPPLDERAFRVLGPRFPPRGAGNGGADRRPGRRRCRGRTFKKKKKSEVRLACLGSAKGKERARRIDRWIAREPPADPFPGARAPGCEGRRPPVRSVARVEAPHAPSNKMALLYPRETPILFLKTRPFFCRRLLID